MHLLNSTACTTFHGIYPILLHVSHLTLSTPCHCIYPISLYLFSDLTASSPFHYIDLISPHLPTFIPSHCIYPTSLSVPHLSAFTPAYCLYPTSLHLLCFIAYTPLVHLPHLPFHIIKCMLTTCCSFFPLLLILLDILGPCWSKAVYVSINITQFRLFI